MQKRFIPAITMLTAGAVTSITCIINKLDILFSLELLLGVLVVFYILGCLANVIISKVLEVGNVKEQEPVKPEDKAQEEKDDTEMTLEPSQEETGEKISE